MENGRLIYGRKIYEGIGSRLYGLEVAEHIVENEEFLGLAGRVRRQLLGVEEEIVSTRKSVYNAEVYVNECEVCRMGGEGGGGELEVHHVNSQKFADCDGSIDYFNKNHKGNLVVLCHEHHGKVHMGELILGGWVDSLGGRVLDWRVREVERPVVRVHVVGQGEGLSEEMREKVRGYGYLMKNLSMRVVREKIRKDLGVDVTPVLMKKIFSGV